MKIFKLIKVRYKNIMSVGQQAIEIDLSSHHKTLITGKNGGGKSTMLEAITFALFNKPFRDIKKGQLINTFNKKDLLVELWMEYNGDSFYIKRGQKPNVFEVCKNGEPIEETSSIKDFQAYFESLIQMNYNSFKQVVVLGTAGYTPFMQLTAANRRKLVEDLLEVSILADMATLNKTALKEVAQNISVLDMKKDHISTEISTHKEYAERQRKSANANIERLSEMYREKVDAAKAAKAKAKEISIELESIQLPENPDDKLTRVVSKIGEKTNNIKSLTRVIDLYDKGGCCPTCLQELVPNDKVDEIKHNCDNESVILAKLNAKRDELNTLRQAYSKVVNEVNEKRQKERELKSLVESSVSEAKRINAAIDKAQEEFIDNSDKIAELQRELNKVLDDKSNLVMEKYNRSIIAEMLKDSGIKSAIVKKYIPLFNKKINYYLKMLEADYVFTLDEEFNESIKSRGREEFSYASFSQGEKGRIDIALLFTWRDIAEMVSQVRIQCLFMDEVTDTAGLDAQGYRNLSIILDNMSDFNFFIISHRDQDTSKYNHHIEMKKIGRFTVME